MYYFDGTKFKALRQLNSITEDGNEKSTVIADSLFYIDQDEVGPYNHAVRYGKVIQNGRSTNIFSNYLGYPLFNDMGLVIGLRIETIFAYGDAIFATAPYAGGTLKSIRWDNSDSGLGNVIAINNTSTYRTWSFQFNTRVFTSQVKLRKIVAIFDSINEATGDVISYGYKDDTGTIRMIAQPATVGDLSGKTRVSIDVNSVPATKEISAIVDISQRARLKSLEYFYESVETPVNS